MPSYTILRKRDLFHTFRIMGVIEKIPYHSLNLANSSVLRLFTTYSGL